MPSRKITRTVSGQMTLFRGADVKSNRDESTFPSVNIVQSVKQGDEYVNIDSIELTPFRNGNITFVDGLNLSAESNIRMVGTVELALVNVSKASNGRTYAKWEVTKSDLTPSDQVPYAPKRESAATEAAADAAPVTSQEAPF